MTIGADDELLQDFLVEAGEILDALGGQLLDLEQNPTDADLLNAIFRGFHTIKGGAGFLSLTPLVDVCHHAEDVFNQLRQGERSVDSDLMDVILAVLDALNLMFGNLRSGQMPEPASADLMRRLADLVAGVSSAPAEPASPIAEEPSTDDADAAFEAMLEAAEESPAEPAASAPVTSSDEITDDEFEALLDQLHGSGKHGGSVESVEEAASPAASAGDEISEAEFEALLDQLYGKGAPPGEMAAKVPAATPAKGQSQQPTGPAPSKTPPAKSAVPAAKKEDGASAPAPRAGQQAAAAPAAAAPAAESTVRVDVKRLDDIMNLVGELVLVRNRLVTLSTQIKEESVSGAISSLELVTTDLQVAVMRTRMQPIKKVFGRFPRVVRDLAKSLHKQVDLELRGEDTELDKNLVEALADPLVHLVRNSVDHGIEMPEDRARAGKPETGRLVLSAAQQGDHILLVIEDDGKGMDAALLRNKAIEKGLIDDNTAQRMTDAESFDLIFRPGFSTKEQVSDVSGRGVGMDVVKTRIAGLNGAIEIDSVLGRGTIIRIRLPLTLAIVPTLMVRIRKRPFAIPLSSIGEILDMDLTQTKIVDNREVIVVRGKALPLVRLGEWLRLKEPKGQAGDEPMGHVVVAYVDNRRVGYVVDELLGQEEVVIKPLGPGLRHVPGYAGATITGDGHLALILDLPGLMRAKGLAA
ncbi:chemotaxis protein CheA [Acidihalobacter aeolianus]|uniref:Chemotaxis protein CheA n=1 Tax=Acidihalobacter aeolianus TaxID=2792603 RepID=A0A1D8K6N9_9GAMM|nr:chemotaxis protein CheA [Acidihalobacter aeolianus]AOV16647.1 chemotaxis protein CheA [Acidihalobacter aeolianus]